MVRLVKYFVGFIAAVLVAEVLGAIFQVQGTIRQQFAPLGIKVPLEEQLSWMLHDIAGLIPTYAPLLAAAFLIAFIVAAFVARPMPGLRIVVFTVAGAVGVLVLFLLSKPVFWQVTPIYGGRDAFGLALQCLAGGVGGLVFALITRKRA
ncbi:MAG: hypothetical protein ACLFV8_10860 [Alphaproteobacteria bacterium]